MNQQLGLSSIGMLALVTTTACESSQMDSRRAESDRQTVASSVNSQPAATTDAGNDVTNQQAPISQRFDTLDAYLAHLERTEAPVDGPWYREVSPGVYELQTGNLHLDTGDQKRTFTRQELERKFGFSE